MVNEKVTVAALAGLISESLYPGHPSIDGFIRRFVDDLIDLVIEPIEKRGGDIIVDLEHTLRDMTNPAAFGSYSRFIETAFIPLLKDSLRSALMTGICGQGRIADSTIRQRFAANAEIAAFEESFSRMQDTYALATYTRLMNSRIQEASKMAEETYRFGLRLRANIGERLNG